MASSNGNNVSKEFAKLEAKAQGLFDQRDSRQRIRIQVGSATCEHAAGSREVLDETAVRLRDLGATITDGPREFPEYRPGYHALFFLDPDGIKLELVWTPQGTYNYQRGASGSSP